MRRESTGSMSLASYLKDRILLILLQIVCLGFLLFFLRITGYPKSNCILITVVWGLVFLVWLSVHYISRRNYFKKMKEMMEQIDQRYLLGELMPDSVHLEDQIYRELIRKSNKSVIERIRAIEDEKKEYREYIESWVHEIKAPITGIDLMCENHKETLTRRIALENRKIENYVDMALYYARSDEVYQDYMIRETDLGQTAAEILQRNKQYLIQKGIRAEVNCPDVAYTDGKWIGFILNQLLLNSAKYSKEQGAYIRIFTEHTENGVRLTVKDNGIGIKPEEIERIFEKGFTGSNVTKAVDRVSFHVDQGEFIGVMGASGSGKTTLLNMLSTIDRVTAGHIYYQDVDITELSEDELSDFRKKNLGFVFQDYNLLDTLTLEENILLAMTLRKGSRKEIQRKCDQMMKLLGIDGIKNQFPYEVSGGQKQRCACARALVNEPCLLLADEPTGALDSKSAQTLLRTFAKLNETLRTTIFMVTHDAFSASYCSRILFLKDGSIFHELVRGKKTRRDFLNEILDVLSLTGGELADE